MLCSNASTKGVAPSESLAFDALKPFGWNQEREATYFRLAEPGTEPGRVVAATRGLALVQTPSLETWCTPSGRFRDRLAEDGLNLCVGDWVIIQPEPEGSKSVIHDLLPRGAYLARHEAGPTSRSQALAANLDLVLLLMGLDQDFNPSRLERFLALAWGSGAQPVVVLTKADLDAYVDATVARIEGIAPGVNVLAVSSHTGQGVEAVQALFGPGRTAAMVGSSGVGKSTLLNFLAGQDWEKTQAVREGDGRGRHTTSMGSLYLLPGGGCLIDTPGVREVGLSAEGADVDETFSDISELADRCRFRDCTHGAEPGCAVQEALAEGLIDPDRYGNYLRLRKELDYEAARSDERLWRERERKTRQVHETIRKLRKG